MKSAHIHILGASGSGTTTLAAALAQELGAAHLDTDTYYWLPTEPPFTTPRPVDERLQLLGAELDLHASWVLSGSLMGWGDVLIPRFKLVAFLYVPPDIRIARLLARQRQRYGTAIDPGGSLHASNVEFIEWAKRYEEPAFDGRSLVRHRAWLEQLPCSVLQIMGTPTLEDNVARVLAALRGDTRAENS